MTPLSDRLILRFEGYARKLGLKLPVKRHNIDSFTGDPRLIPNDEKQSTPMHRAFYQNSGNTVHKWRSYLSRYDRHLARYRGTAARILEIGVYKGGSLELWRNYFGPSAIIYGIDIDPRCSAYDGIAGKVRIGSQGDPDFLRAVIDEMTGLDVVIDDGSHISSHQRISFETLFPLLASDGTYICEDVVSSYFRGYFEGGYRRRTSFIEIMKNLVDDLNADFHERPQTLRNAHREVDGAHFYQGMVVIEKRPQPRPSHMKVPPL
jgi:hypothetical protein